MATERVLSNLNLISFKTEGGLQNHIDELQDGDLAFTPDNSLKGNLFDFKWADHLLNDMSWLRADTFSWQSGDVYVAAYNHLATDFENIASETLYAWDNGVGSYVYTLSESPSVGDSVYDSSGVLDSFRSVINVADGGIYVGEDEVSSLLYTRDSSRDTKIPQTDTIGDITITYYLAQDGHKICLPDQEDKVLELYNATGVAWYYILDTANKQFKLPLSKHNKYADTVPVVGNGMALGITNGQTTRAIGATTVHNSQTTTALMLSRNEPNNMAVGTSVSVTNAGGNDLGTGKAYGVATTPDSSGLIAQQEQDTDQYKYLYFYVGNFERDALEQTAGIVAEMFNGKADSDLKNIPANYDYVVESQLPTVENGYTWYRKYKSGWVEQGGICPSLGYTVTFPVVMVDVNYTALGTARDTSGNYAIRIQDVTTTGMKLNSSSSNQHAIWWQVSGVSAQ